MPASLDWFGVLWGLQEVRHAAKGSTLCCPLFCALVFAVEILEEYQMGWYSSLVILLSSATFCGQWLLPSSFFPCISCSGVECNAGGLQLFVIGRQWEAGLGCLCVGWWLQMKSYSKVTRWQLCHILLTRSAWPALFLTLCSSPGLFYIDRLTVFNPSLSLPRLVCEGSQPECLPKVENRRHFSVFRA